MRVARRVLAHGVAVYVILTLLTMTSSFVISGLEVHAGQVPVPQYGSWYVVYLAIVGFTINSIVTWLVSGYRAATGNAKQQLRTVAWTLGISVFAAFMTNLIIPLLTGSTQSALLFPIPIMAMMVGLSYAIAKNGLLDIKAATVRSVAYVLSLLTMAGIYFVLAYLTSVTIFRGDTTSGVSSSPVNIVLALILALVFQPVRHFFDRATAKIFLREAYDVQEVTSQISAACVESTDLAVLVKRVGGLLKGSFEPEYLLVVFNDTAHDTIAFGKVPQRLNIPRAELRDELAPLVLRLDIPHERSKYIAGVYRLETSSQHLGYIVVGQKSNGHIYTRNDIALMDLTVGELSVAIQNIFRLEEIRSFASTLEREVDEATSELRSSNEKLRELDATKDEFVSMASHQLRTPLTSVKGYISMVLEGDAGKISKQQRQLLGEAFTSSERMVHLIADFLNVSRLQTGKFVVDRKPFDLGQLIAQEVANITQIAESHNIKLHYKQAARVPTLYIDEGKMRQVVMNFIDNAIYYSPDGTPVNVTLTLEDGEVVLRVIDKGMGVPDEAKKKLFGKFFRAENARKQRPDGTGVGLFLAKKVIDGHGGTVLFESTIGKGSTFGFRLPVKKLSEPPSVDEQDAASGAPTS
jgi:signal transduction histidine kinase